MTATLAPKAEPATGRLATFLAAARSRVAAGAYRPEGPRLESNGSLTDRVQRGGALLAELKPASPAEGTLLRRPVDALLAAYAAGGADALSVLTDADHFGGSPALLRQAHKTGLPTLMKDFIVDEAQLDCAVHAGAGAVLLIERALGPARREELVRAAHARGLEVLLEVFDAADWASARSSAADLVGVNARDLDTLSVDRERALILLGQVAQRRAGRAVALSGIADRAAARAALACGAGAVLVGTALLRAADPALLLRSLRRPLAKVCGLRTPEDVAAASVGGADLAGFVVGSPGSPRDLAIEDAVRLVAEARTRGLRAVLVTRAADAAGIAAWCRATRPDFVQLHAPVRFGPETDLGGAQVLAAVGPGDSAPAPPPSGPSGRGVDVVGFLLDGAAEGGGGRTHDWDAARLALGGSPPSMLTLVAGGLHAGNAAEAVRRSGASGADASSGLESTPGRKDPQRIADFVRAVHAA